MILTGTQILKSIKSNHITIKPFFEDNVSTNSYDLSLGYKYIRYLDDVLDPYKNNAYEEKEIPDDGLFLKKGDFVLTESYEVIGTDHLVPKIHGKSGVARKGLFIHITADLIDIGYYGKITLQLYATQNIVLYKRMKIAQISFWIPKGDITLYKGKYQQGSGPQPSKIYCDIKKGKV